MFQLCWRTESHCLVRSFLSHQHCQEDKTKTRNQPFHQSRAVGHQHHTDHCSSSATTLIPACLSSESITWFLNCRAHTHTQLMPAVFMRTWTIHALSSAWTGYRATRPHFCFSWLSSNCQKGRWAYTWSTNRTNCGIYIDVVSIVPSFSYHIHMVGRPWAESINPKTVLYGATSSCYMIFTKYTIKERIGGLTN